MYVAETQTTVLTATVITITQASALGSPGAKRGRTYAIAASEVTNEATIAEISLHALMRHQYQRRISTSPVPAPMASRNFHAPSTEESCEVTPIEARKRNTVVIRETFT